LKIDNSIDKKPIYNVKCGTNLKQQARLGQRWVNQVYQY